MHNSFMPTLHNINIVTTLQPQMFTVTGSLFRWYVLMHVTAYAARAVGTLFLSFIFNLHTNAVALGCILFVPHPVETFTTPYNT